MADAVARAASVPAALVRRAAMLSGDLGRAAVVALTEGAAGLRGVGLEVGRGVLPMLAAGAPDVGTALADVGLASVEWKLDGARIQVHRLDDDVRDLHPQPQRHHRPVARRRRRGRARCRCARSCSTARRSASTTRPGRTRSRTR